MAATTDIPKIGKLGIFSYDPRNLIEFLFPVSRRDEVLILALLAHLRVV